MKKRLFACLCWTLLLPSVALASHIAGGNIEFVALDKPGNYRLSLNLYFDDASKGPDAVIEPSITLSIFRQRDHQLISDHKLNFIRRLPLVYANPACARSRGLVTSEVRYSDTITLDPSRFDDAVGYYVVWEKCCRNQNVVNILSPQASGMIYYLAFPPLMKDGAPFRNSSPVFLTPNAEYICLNKQFTLAFRATDADGDQLRYSLTTPYNDNVYKPSGFANSPNNPAYRLLNWVNGYGPGTAIPGDPPLRVGRESGVLFVRPNRIGLFVFTVLCEEYRNGQKLGEVRRDHQILVVDCSPQVPPKPPIASIDPAGSSPLEFCEGSIVTLQTEADTNFNYQWRYNGYNLPGQNKQTLRATDPGEYTVIKSFATVCTRDSVSEPFRLTFKRSHRAEIQATDTTLCVGESIALTANQRDDFRYQWTLNGKDISGATSPSYNAPEAGRYVLKINSSTSGCTALDSVTVLKSRLEQVAIKAALPNQPLCEGSQLTAAVEQTNTRLSYAWQRDGKPIPNDTTANLKAAQPGSYALTVTDANSCSLTSAVVQVSPKPQPVLDSLPPICGTAADLTPLQARPAGGTFAGIGVTNNQFDAKVAGVGRHRITYTVTNEAGCAADTTRFINVVNVPPVDLGPDLKVIVSNEITLRGPVDAGLLYRWEPTTGTNASLAVRPEQTTTYRLTVSRDGMCPVSDEVLVEVMPGLFIPTAFSPNGDGTNDTWELKGAEAFPDCNIRIYNRWGELIYQATSYNQPWDGRYMGQFVGAGAYQYTIKPAAGLPEQRGTLTVMR